MRIQLFAAIGVAGLVSILSTASSNATNVVAVHAVGDVRQHASNPVVRQMSRPRAGATPLCDMNASTSFVGVSGTSDFAGGSASGVVGGENDQACGEDSGVSGGIGNMVFGASSYIGAGGSNYVGSGYGFVGAGLKNTVNEGYGGIGAGVLNSVTGFGSFIGGGDYEFYQDSSDTTPGNQISGTDSFLGAGDQNVIASNESFIGAGQSNSVTSAGTESVIAGGNGNYVSGVYAAIGGGSGNKAEGAFAVIPGGADDEALGAASFAGGYHADAAHNGSFVWSDDSSGSKVVSDTNVDQFVVRATGGTFIYSSETLASGVKLASGSGTWSSLSDRNAKNHVVALDDTSILEKVEALPVDAWAYKTESGVKHIGPMAQDFYAAFGVGEDDRHITSIDEDGVALAAIKGLYGKLQRTDARLRVQNALLAAKLAALSAKVDKLVAASPRR